MRVFIAVLVLIFSLQSWTKADDISDFEIEGMSIGDSLLKYFSKSLIDSKKTFPAWSSKKFTRFVSFENLKTYDAILIYFEDNGDYVISLDNGTATNRIQFFRTATNDRIYIMVKQIYKMSKSTVTAYFI